MKQWITISLAVLLLLSCAAGCAQVDEGPQTEPSGSTAPSATRPKPTEPSQNTEPVSPSVPEQTEPSVMPTEPTVTEPAPTEPTPTEPAPTEPVPSTPKPIPGNLYTRAELEKMKTKVNGWGLGPHTVENNRPVDAVKAQEKYGKYDACYIGPDDGKIYLTFDEGYENGYTSRILDVLKEKNVKAVFFITMPYAKSQPALVQRMIDEGHVVGNHSVKHKSMPTLSIDTMIEEVMGLHDYVKEHFGYEMHLFRPPMGEYSEQSLAVLQNLGYKTVEWSFAYFDYDPDKQPEPAKALEKVTNAAHSGGIILLHAVSKTNTEILGDVIDAYRAKGLELALFN